MRQAIISDLHSNIQALTEVLKDIEQNECDSTICLGDIVDYGANPNEVIAELDGRGIECLLGNHDQYVQSRLQPNGASPVPHFEFSRESILKSLQWTLENLNERSQRFIKGLSRPIMTKDGIDYAHGSPRPGRENQEYLFPRALDGNTLVLEQGDEVFAQFEKLCFVGHTHVAGIIWKEGNKCPFEQPSEESKIYPADRKLLVTVGSVGQPRDRDMRACYVIYDSKQATIEFKRVEYDIEKAAEAILEAGLPFRDASRLYSGT